MPVVGPSYIRPGELVLTTTQHHPDGAAEATGNPPHPRVQPVAPPASSGPRILVVDDTASVRASLRLLLDEMGIEVVGEASDGTAAARMAAYLKPDVVLMDLRMPVMDGLEATRQITRLGLDLQVLMISAYATPAFEVEAKEAGAVGLIAKGEHPSTIVEAIERAWRERRDKGDADTSGPRAMLELTDRPWAAEAAMGRPGPIRNRRRGGAEGGDAVSG